MTQLWPLAQTLLQAPQWFVLSVRFVSQPLLAIPSQLPKPGLQLEIEQTPELQAAVPLVELQTEPHKPQLEVVFRFVSQPLLASPSQLPKPGLQEATLQTLAIHAGVPLAALQMLLQAPQLLTSVVVFTQVPLQSVCPLAQLVVTHEPFTQLCPLEQAAQTAPAVPQELAVVGVTQVLPLQQPFGQEVELQLVEEVHCPLTQVWPLKHAWPQVPQLAGSFAVFTHAPPHTMSPPGQEAAHRPPVQMPLAH